MLRKLMTLIVLGLYWGLAILGVRGNHHAMNIFTFSVVALTLVGIVLLVLATSKGYNPKAVDENYLPSMMWLGLLTDVLGSLLLASYGHFWLAGLVVFQCIVEQITYRIIYLKLALQKLEV